jgi:hypothetical protein
LTVVSSSWKPSLTRNPSLTITAAIGVLNERSPAADVGFPDVSRFPAAATYEAWILMKINGEIRHRCFPVGSNIVEVMPLRSVCWGGSSSFRN